MQERRHSLPEQRGIATALTLGGTATADATTNSSTIDFSGAAQSLPGITFYNLTASGSGTTKTAAGALVINGALTINSNVVLDMATYALSGTLGTLTNNGTIKTRTETAGAEPQ